MSLVAALALIAQASAPGAVAAPVSVAEQATATARVLRPVAIRVDAQGAVALEAAEASPPAQRSRDAAGTVWIEFS